MCQLPESRGRNCIFGRNPHVFGRIILGNYVSIGNDCTLITSAEHHNTLRVKDNVFIGNYTVIKAISGPIVIEDDSFIGNACNMEANSSSGIHVGDGTNIGNSCIMSGSIATRNGVMIGNHVELSVHHDNEGISAKHLILHDYVDIGNNVIIRYGNTKISNLVTIGSETTLIGITVIDVRSVIGTKCNLYREVKIGRNVNIGSGCLIEEEVTIGDGTNVGVETTIRKGAEIGHRAVIGSHVIIGVGSVICDDAIIPSRTVVADETRIIAGMWEYKGGLNV